MSRSSSAKEIIYNAINDSIFPGAQVFISRGDDIILNSLEPHIILWFFLASFSIAADSVILSEPFDPYKQSLSTIILTILILSITLSISKMLVGLFNLWAEKQGQGFPSTTMFTNFVYIIVWGIGLMIILDSLNIAITPILTALGVGGLAISLALIIISRLCSLVSYIIFS